MFVQLFDIGYQILGGVVGEFGMWCGFVVVMLIEQYNVVYCWIEEVLVFCVDVVIGIVVQEYYWFVVWVVVLFVVECVQF